MICMPRWTVAVSALVLLACLAGAVTRSTTVRALLPSCLSLAGPGGVICPAPAVSYYAPAVSYYAPAVSYYAPAVSYYAPAVSYYAPAVSYYAPARAYYSPGTATTYRYGLFGAAGHLLQPGGRVLRPLKSPHPGIGCAAKQRGRLRLPSLPHCAGNGSLRGHRTGPARAFQTTTSVSHTRQ